MPKIPTLTIFCCLSLLMAGAFSFADKKNTTSTNVTQTTTTQTKTEYKASKSDAGQKALQCYSTRGTCPIADPGQAKPGELCLCDWPDGQRSYGNVGH